MLQNLIQNLKIPDDSRDRKQFKFSKNFPERLSLFFSSFVLIVEFFFKQQPVLGNFNLKINFQTFRLDY